MRAPSAPPQSERRAALRVLLIDPSPEEAKRVRALLDGLPEFRLHSACDLREAEALLDDGQFDAALVESQWWTGDGARLVAFLRERRPDVAIVVMTSGDNEREALPALKLGAHDFVSKRNLDAEQLGARLLLAVEESRSLRRRDTMVRWLEREARTDHLSGLHNRRAFDDRLRETCAAARAHDQRVTLILVDVIGTREVNEAHGHEAGDAMIRRAATGVQRSVRAVDFAARIGGDDFGIIIADGDLELGRRIARRIAHEIERSNGEPGSDIPVSVVFGVASGIAPDSAELFAAADQQITQHKRGRSLAVALAPWEDFDGPSVA